MQQLTQTSLTDEMIDEARAIEGMQLRIEQWNHEATLDTIRHYAWGIGDNNPIFCDEAYANESRFGAIVAPPMFLYSVCPGAMGIGMAGLQPIYGGTKWEFHDWIRRGDRISVDARVGPIKVMSGEHASRFVLQTVLSTYFRQDGKVIATSEGRTFRIPRAGADGGLSYTERPEHVYTNDELEAIRLHAVSEPRRGAEPRFWEQVEVGEQIPTIVKGPVDQMTMTAYYAGNVGSPATKSCELSWLYRTWATDSPENLPNNYDPTFYSERVAPALGHQIATVAREIGMPGRYDNGAQRSGWFGHIVLNWMGDHGDMLALETRLNRPEIYGDTVWITAEVVGKRDGGLVDVAMTSTNQLGVKTGTATATVRLPIRQS